MATLVITCNSWKVMMDQQWRSQRKLNFFLSFCLHGLLLVDVVDFIFSDLIASLVVARLCVCPILLIICKKSPFMLNLFNIK